MAPGYHSSCRMWCRQETGHRRGRIIVFPLSDAWMIGRPFCGWISSDLKLRSQPWSRSQTKNSKHPGMSKHVVRKLYVRPDSSLWHNRNNSVLLGSCKSKQGQGGKIRPRWHVKDTLNTVTFMRKQYHLIIMRDQNPPLLWTICWTG